MDCKAGSVLIVRLLLFLLFLLFAESFQSRQWLGDGEESPEMRLSKQNILAQVLNSKRLPKTTQPLLDLNRNKELGAGDEAAGGGRGENSYRRFKLKTGSSTGWAPFPIAPKKRNICCSLDMYCVECEDQK